MHGEALLPDAEDSEHFHLQRNLNEPYEPAHVREARLAAMELAASMVHNVVPITGPIVERELVSYDDL